MWSRRDRAALVAACVTVVLGARCASGAEPPAAPPGETARGETAHDEAERDEAERGERVTRGARRAALEPASALPAPTDPAAATRAVLEPAAPPRAALERAEVDPGALAVAAGAAVGAAALGAEPTAGAGAGRSEAVDVRLSGLAHAPFPVPEGAPEALVHAPAGALDGSGPLDVVLFLHGYSGCVEVLARDAEDVRCRPAERRGREGFGVVGAHDGAGTRTVLVLPQLAWMTRDGSPGRFGRPGEARAFLEEALARAGIARPLGRVTIAAHSAAFESALAIIRRGGLGAALRHVVLLDALYSGGPALLGWAREGTDEAPRTLVSLYTGGTTARRSAALGRDARAALGSRALLDPDEGLAALAGIAGPARVLVLRARVAHGEVPRRHLGPALAALGLPRR